MLAKISKQLLKSQRYNFSTWQNVPQAPPDPILGISEAFKRDNDPNKVSLGVGAYRDDNGKPVILDCVKKALSKLDLINSDNEYLPVEGLQSFIDASVKLAYGADSEFVKNKRVAGLQCLSGTGGLRVGFDFLKKYLPEGATVYLPNPTWPNHNNICYEIKLPQKNYRYLDKQTKGLDINGMLEDIEAAPNRSIVLLHVCSHNPTGVDPKPEQWKQIREVIYKKGHIAFFDSAYLGFTSGDLLKDTFALKLFSEKKDIPIVLAQSYAKNFGLYGQRVGCFSVVCDNEKEAQAVQSQLKIIARRNYSNPPLYGARIVSAVLNDPELFQIWLKDIKTMATRISDMRTALKTGIVQNGSKHNWDHITNQIGMFAYTGISSDAVKMLTEKFHIYLTSDGRISMSGVNTKNVNYISKAFHESTK